MSSEIEVPETPNWLKDLEDKRERRLKARLGHEAGAGAPCLKCEDKCPGLDLHFWRKACKICRCPKEEHDVPDDDIYGWAQFQLLGSKPNKVKTKIVLPGKKDEVELEWAPKGQKETVDKYLKTLPPEILPVKGSQAAQERKQLLQKQIPVHDIDPSLCHELNEEEVKKMEDYIDHVKKSSVGVGQIVNLSSVIKANLHNISPQEAHIIASRYSKGVPLSELVKLQAGLAKNLENLTLNTPQKKPLKEMQQVNLTQEESLQNPLLATKFKDITHPWYSNSSPGKGAASAQFSENVQKPDYAIDRKLLQGTNFDPSKTPSQFLRFNTPGYRPKGDSHQDQYGFENPYFNQHKSEEQNPQAPKSVKDLIYSNYDPSKGPVPHDEGSLENPNPKVPGYDPNMVPNTFKHDPSVFQSVPMDPAKIIPQGIPRFDPVTGKCIEDYRYPQNMAGESMIDPVTGKYLPGNGEGTHGNSSGKPILGQHIGKMPRFDPKSGKYIEEDLRYPQNLAGGAIFDPFTGKYLAESRENSEEAFSRVDPFTGRINSGHHFGQMPKFDPESGKCIDEDLRYPQSVAGDAIFDPITGKYISENRQGTEKDLSRVDPVTGKLIPHHHFGQMPRFDPETGKYITDDSVYPQNVGGGAIFDPVTGKYLPETWKEGLPRVDPVTGQPIPGHHFGQMPTYDAETGKYITYPQNLGDDVMFDPVTGKYLPESGQGADGELPRVDPVTGKPIPGYHIGQMPRFDPETGKYAEGEPKYPQNMDNEVIFDPVTGKYLPEKSGGKKTHEGLARIDPATGKPLPSHQINQLPRFDPKTGHYIEDNPRYPHNVADARVFDPNTGKYVSNNQRNNSSGGELPKLDPITGNPILGHHQLPRYDPETGKCLGEEYRYPQSEGGAKRVHYKPNTGITESGQIPTDGQTPRINPATGQPWNLNDVPIFDPVTGKYIPEDQRLASISDSKKPSVLESIRHFENAMSPDPKGLKPGQSPNRLKKPLSALQPGQINVSEDYLEPHMVNIGAIQDINPEIRAATTKLNPGFEDDIEDNNADYSPDTIREILNNIKLPDCHYCKKPFEENEFAVTIDRANVLFHAQCFKCAGCNQSLADNIYFYYKDTNNVYCGRDYAKIMGYPRCSACDELIFTKEYCLAENSTFHLKHFCCFQCDTPLAGQDYTLEDEKPYCLPCFETSKAAKCSTCEKVIKPDEIGCQLNGVHFHAEDRCFRCIVCSVPLMGKKMLLRNEKLYCSHECFNTRKK